ncbi:hypothetical protein E4U11_000923 [Claviceps purpurea]|nr:hypothetical protein E4U11_000923 [Claviceps purpurea]
MTCDRTLSDAEFEDGTEVVAEIEYVDGDDFSHATLNLHLLSAYVERFRAGMHPEAICAETVHFASAIPDFPISAENGFAYLIDTRRIDKDDLAEPWNAMRKVSVLRHQHTNMPRCNTILHDAGLQRPQTQHSCRICL